MNAKKKPSGRKLITWLLGLLALATLSGCEREPYMLGIVGYNYTDRAIANFAVNGQWGGNVVLSTPTSGEEGTLCCVVMNRRTKTPFWVEVEYQMDALVSYSTRKEIEPEGPYVKTRVKVEGPISPDPEYLEIHFYPDHHIEAAISGQDGPSPPRLNLERRLPFVR